MKKTITLLFILALMVHSGIAQDTTTSTGLHLFNNPGKSWTVAGNIFADQQKDNLFRIEKGSGIIVNQPSRKQAGTDLLTNMEYGDADIDLDFMTARNSNSGIYLQNRYEIQLRDSWGLADPSAYDNGAVYGQYAPRSNASRAPGIWQHLYISFRAPRFDASGKKTENARLLQVKLNDVIIHENVELLSSTPGAVSNDETAKAPIRIQGDHGTIAFKNIRITDYSAEQPELSAIKYSVYHGKFEFIPDYSEYEPAEEGQLKQLGTTFLTKESEFLIRFTADVNIKQAGNYIFQRETNGGGYVKIDNQMVSDPSSYTTKPVALQPGIHKLEAGYTKPFNWFPTSFGLKISADNIREFLASDPKSLARSFPDPVIIDPVNYPVMRSFIDIPGSKRITHAISVGSTQQLHYSYDLDNGALFQAWRGQFLDATAMWVGRGDGSARPLGSTLHFNTANFPILTVNSENNPVVADSATTAFLNLGYELGKGKKVTYHYNAFGATIHDAIVIDGDGKTITRNFAVENNPGNLMYTIAEGVNIEAVTKQLFLVDNKSYYIRINDPKLQTTLRQINGKWVLLAPLNNNLDYSIFF